MSKRVKLADFCAYVAQRQREIQGVYAEIEEVQFQFNEAHRQVLQAWQAALSQGVPMLSAGAALPPPLAQDLLRVVEEERARLQGEIADLAAQVQARRAEADAALKEAQDGLNALRRMNPQLNANEEAIKARHAGIQQSIQRLEAQIKATGFLSGLFERRRLRRERDRQRQALAELKASLRRVREAWQEEKRGYELSQSQLQARWESATTEAAQQQARLDYLQNNLERLSRENGAARYLAELRSVPEAPEPLRPVLVQMVELNQVKADYEEGLRAVAEALGLLKSLAEGMGRFYKSAAKVREEQHRYKLRELSLELSDTVLSFHSLWPEFKAQVHDEKALGQKPLEFSRRVQTTIQSRLGDQSISAMFDNLGDALTRATKAWD